MRIYAYIDIIGMVSNMLAPLTRAALRYYYVSYKDIPTKTAERLQLLVCFSQRSNVVAAVIRGHTRMLSANFGRSQGIRRMLSAFTKH